VSEITPSANTGRRRRADAERSIAAILAAAGRVLATRPNASIDDIAQSAGISRQTVYSHFASREALLNALLTQVTERVLDAIALADLDTGPAADALIRFLEISWQVLDESPFLLHLASPPQSAEQELQQHEPILGPLEHLIKRGQRTGEFDRTLPVGWLLAATIALGHAAGEEVRARRMTTQQALDTLRRSIPRLFADTGIS